jgi:hypothetical protein
MHRATLALAVALSLLVSAPGGNGFLDPLWELLSSVGATSTADEGCGFDPNGACVSESEPRGDIGCGWDPNGACQPGS